MIHIKSAKAIISQETYNLYETKEPQPGAFININEAGVVTVITKEKIKNYTQKSIGWKRISITIDAPPDSKGIFAQIANEFAKLGISIIPIASFSKAYVFVKKQDIKKAKLCLYNLGIEY